MIINFKHKGLEELYCIDSKKGINSNHANKIKRILIRLNTAKFLDDLNVPSFKLHPLKGNLDGLWSIEVTGNYRIIFKFDELKQEVYDVDFIDYH